MGKYKLCINILHYIIIIMTESWQLFIIGVCGRVGKRERAYIYWVLIEYT